MREAYRENTRVAMEILDRHGVGYQAPRGAFYLWIDVGREDSAEFAKELLLREHVSVAPGGTFGPSGERRVRVSLASPRESIREGLTRMTRFLGK
jgi:aspartate/methionine/tyrosine aminotransferase